MLYGYEIEPFRFQLTKDKLKIKNLYKKNSLGIPMGAPKMKFDVVLINPPYESKEEDRGIHGGNNKKLWKEFLTLSLSMLKEDGHLIFLSPTSWANGAKNPHNNINIFQDYIKELEVIDIDMNADKHFPGKSTNISCIILQNKKRISKLTKVNNIELDLSKFEMLPKNVDNITLSIFNKISNLDKFKFTMVRKDLSKNIIDNNTDEYKYKTYLGRDGIKYTNIQNEYTIKKKVLTHRMGSVKFIYDEFDNITPSYSQIYILSEEDSMDSIKSILESKLIKFIYSNLKYTQYNESKSLSQLPKLDTTKIWSDGDIYEELNLSTEQIKYIENYVG